MSKRSPSVLKQLAKKLEYGAAVSPSVPKQEFEREKTSVEKWNKRKAKGKTKSSGKRSAS